MGRSPIGAPGVRWASSADHEALRTAHRPERTRTLRARLRDSVWREFRRRHSNTATSEHASEADRQFERRWCQRCVRTQPARLVHRTLRLLRRSWVYAASLLTTSSLTLYLLNCLYSLLHATNLLRPDRLLLMLLLLLHGLRYCRAARGEQHNGLLLLRTHRTAHKIANNAWNSSMHSYIIRALSYSVQRQIR